MKKKYHDSKPVAAKKNNSQNTGKSATSKNDAGKTKYQGKASEKDTKDSDDPRTKNETNKKDPSIFKL